VAIVVAANQFLFCDAIPWYSGFSDARESRMIAANSLRGQLSVSPQTLS